MPPQMLRWRSFRFVLLLLGSVASARAADLPLCPGSSPTQASAPQKPAPAKAVARVRKPGVEDGLVDISSEHAEYRPDGTLILKGNVHVHQGDRDIHADEVQYNKNSQSIRSQGGLEYQDPLLHVTGDGGNYSPTGGADFRTAQFDLRQRAARGSANALQLTPEGVISLQGVRFTTCPKAEEAWSLKAASVTLDTRSKIGTARSARVDFEGLPILYLPWLSFPLDNERKSGFLFPTLGNNSRSGAEVSVPYYWNIAPNADLTFEPILYSRRGADLGGETRFMDANDHGELNWNYLPYDDVTHASRGRVQLTNTMELPDNFRFSINAQNVSDRSYFEDFAQGPEGTSTAFIEQNAALRFRDEHWKIDGELDRYQTIDYTLEPFEHPYARLPRLAASADYALGSAEQLAYGFESEIVNFDRSIPGCGNTAAPFQQDGFCTRGWRVDAMPRASLDINGAGYFIRPGVAWRATQYELQDVASGADRSPSRTLPLASFDSGLMFERDTQDRHITLEPRLYYLYVPYRNQDQLPLFDTTLPDLDPVELFRNNRYVGADRVSDANQVSLAVTSRLLNSADGKQLLSATLGEIYYFTDPRVLLPGEIARTDGRSDFVAQLALTASHDWSADFNLQWNPQAGQMQRTQINLQYKPAPQAVVNFAYRFARDVLEEVELPGQVLQPGQTLQPGAAVPPGALLLPPSELLQQAEISSAWPVARAWNVFVRGIYSIKDHKTLERFGGFEYRACCWRIRLGARSFVSTRYGTESTGIYLQLELTGLASVGSASDSFLMDAIRGYTPPESPAQRFGVSSPSGSPPQ